MTYGLFLILFISMVLLGIIFIFLWIKRIKYGKRPMWISFVVFSVAAIIIIPLGNQPMTGDYKKEASVFTYDKYLNESIPVGTIVKVEGQVISFDDYVIDEEEVFILDGDKGAFYVKNNNVDEIEIKDGEILTIYGGYAGNGDSDSPSINAQIIEK
jgi:hypothetical protein